MSARTMSIRIETDNMIANVHLDNDEVSIEWQTGYYSQDVVVDELMEMAKAIRELGHGKLPLGGDDQ